MRYLSRHLRLLFLTTALVVAAFSTGLTFLFFLVYLTAAILIGSWLYARRGLHDVRADYRVLNPRTHVGEVLQAVYRVENHDWIPKPWVELWNESTLPASLPGRVVGMPSQRPPPVAGEGHAHAARQLSARRPAGADGRSVRALHERDAHRPSDERRRLSRGRRSAASGASRRRRSTARPAQSAATRRRPRS